MKRFRIKKVLMVLTMVIVALLVFGLLVMGLWNAILPDVLGVKLISFWQAMGILVLSKILFSGFGGFAHKKEQFKNRFRQKMREKWEHMTPEEKIQFKEEWKNRCKGWGSRFSERNFTTHEPNEQSENK